MRFRFLLRIAACVLCLAGVAGATPRISEFMAENKETIADEDGDFSDWIEIYNPDSSSVNLNNYSLTDDPLLPKKWTFPSITISSGSHVLVWASGKNRKVIGKLHTNF